MKNFHISLFYFIIFFIFPASIFAFDNHNKDKWLSLLEAPKSYTFKKSLTLQKRYEFETLNLEVYQQANGIGTFQTLYIALPKNLKSPTPAVVVPYYNPEQMLGFFPDTLKQADVPTIAMMRHLAEAGFIVATAETYHLTYIKSDKKRKDFSRWKDASKALAKDFPNWSGMGKLVFDTQLIIDVLASDKRVNAEKIGIAGHSLGGKIAFYTGCIDPRIKVILASDFGIGWEQSNWHDDWYWGKKLEKMKADGLEHSQLLSISNSKPFILLAGKYDNADSFTIMKKASGYEKHPEQLQIINHAKGHRPPIDVLEQGYKFLEKYLGK